MIFTWNIGTPEGGLPDEEQVVGFDRGRAVRVMVLPAWFDEANKLRRFAVEVMRRLDRAGIDAVLPDLPGCNESLAPLADQTLDGWRSAARAAGEALCATHVLAIRAGALLAPVGLPGWHYAAQTGPRMLRGMLRARMISSREAGISTSPEALLTIGRSEGLTLGGWEIGAAMLRALESAEPVLAPGQSDIAHSAIGGPGLWLLAEPDDDAGQADRLAGIITASLESAAA